MNQILFVTSGFAGGVVVTLIYYKYFSKLAQKAALFESQVAMAGKAVGSGVKQAVQDVKKG